jgi:peptidoglycan/xylan/chitin deacetylase (PgdA/CDA1 family)
VRIALTFDAEHPDRPNEAGVTERLLDTLAREGVIATFFIQGRWAEGYPAVARSVADAGHLVGNHSHYHARMPLLSDDGLREDIDDAGHAIANATGVDPRPWFRCPFGAGSTDRRVLGVLAAAGYQHVGEHVAAEDWEPSRNGAAIERQHANSSAPRADSTGPAAIPSRYGNFQMERLRKKSEPDRCRMRKIHSPGVGPTQPGTYSIRGTRIVLLDGDLLNEET